MKNIVKELIAQGKSIPEITRETGMRAEEIFRLADFTRKDFLEKMVEGSDGYSEAERIVIDRRLSAV